MFFLVMASDKAFGIDLTDDEIVGYFKGYKIERLNPVRVSEIEYFVKSLYGEFQFKAKFESLKNLNTKAEKILKFADLFAEFKCFISDNLPDDVFLTYQKIIDKQIRLLTDDDYQDLIHSKQQQRTPPYKETQILELDKAIEFFGLTPPIAIEDVKKRYQTLAKKYHPDLGCKDGDAMKYLNNCYDLLKQHYA